MSSNEQIVIRVTADGAISAETIGMKGAKCLDSINVLEDLLDATTTTSAFTPEYNEISLNQVTENVDELHH